MIRSQRQRKRDRFFMQTLRRVVASLTAGTLILSSFIFGPPFVLATPVQDNNTGTWTDTFAATSGSLSSSAQAGINTASGSVQLQKNDGGGAFTPPYYATGSVVSAAVTPTLFGEWDELTFSTTTTGSTSVTVQVYKQDGTTLIADTHLSGNSSGFTTSPVDLSTIPYHATIGGIKLKASLATSDTDITPELLDWSVSWSTGNGSIGDGPASTGFPTPSGSNRSTNQMNGTFASAYTLDWVNEDLGTLAVVTAGGNVISTLSGSVLTIAETQGSNGEILHQFTLDEDTSLAELTRIDAVASDGSIIVERNISSSGVTYNLQAIRDGSLVWARHLSQYSGWGFFGNLDNEGNVLLRVGHGQLTKFSVTGATLWTKSNGFWNWAGPPSIDSDNNVFVKKTVSGVSAFTSTGGVIFSNVTGGGAGGTPMVDTDGTFFVTSIGACSTTRSLYHISATGAILWTATLPEPGSIINGAEGAVDDLYAYVRSRCSDKVFVYDKSTGSLTATLGDGADNSSQSGHRSLVVDNSKNILYATGDERMLMLDQAGSEQWSYAFTDSVYGDWSITNKAKGNTDRWFTGGKGALSFVPWTLSSSPIQSAFKRGDAISLQVTSSMKNVDPVTGEANKVQAYIEETGTAIPMAYTGTDGDGDSVWSGSYTPPSGMDDGMYTLLFEAASAHTRTSNALHFSSAPTGSNNTGLTTSHSFELFTQLSVSDDGGGGRRGTPGRGGEPASFQELLEERMTWREPDQTSSFPSEAEPEESLYTQSAGFSDIPPTAWFTPYVFTLTEQHIISGYQDAQGNPTGEFKPGNPVTSAETLKIALLSANHSIDPAATPDNPSAQGDWSAPYVAYAEALGLSLYINLSLDVRLPATRGAVIQTLLEAFDYPITATKHPFSDLPADHPHASAIATAYDLGIVTGDTNNQGTPLNTVRPDDPINRAEVAKIVVLLRGLLAE